MLKKPATLLIETEDGKVETLCGEKGDIYAMAREEIRKVNDSGNSGKVSRITAFGTEGILKQHRWRPTEAAPVAAPEPTKAKK